MTAAGKGNDSGTRISSGRYSRLEAMVRAHLRVQRGEGVSLALFLVSAFLLMLCYYILKTLREPLLLAAASAEAKSYASAATGVILFIMVPLYGRFFRHKNPDQIIRCVTAFFAANLILFVVLGYAGFDIGFVYYVWVGIIGVTLLAQFWAHAADAYNPESGARLFPAIMLGATLGGLAGPPLVKLLFPHIGPWSLMLLATALLAATPLLIARSRAAVPISSGGSGGDSDYRSRCRVGGFQLVLRDRYLLLLAVTAVLVNCVNSTGEYILTDLVLRNADKLVAMDPGVSRVDIIADFYGGYYLIVNALTLFLQLFLVSHLFRRIGVQGAFLVLPIVALVGYGLMLFLPVFSVIHAVKILENSADYSVMNTSRHALYLPLSRTKKYDGKTAIDTFFWRIGDLIQAAVIYLGLNWLGFEIEHFAMLNALLALAWIIVAVYIGRGYVKRVSARQAHVREICGAPA